MMAGCDHWPCIACYDLGNRSSDKASQRPGVTTDTSEEKDCRTID